MYGANSGRIRAELTALLRQHRIQQRLGGAGSYTVPATTTVEERAALGERIQRYRHAALIWCSTMLAATDPQTSLGVLDEPAWRPIGELRHRLDRTIGLAQVSLPSLGDLTGPQDFAILEGWRQIAKAAALGEHDFPGSAAAGRLPTQQAMAVIKDVTGVVRALVVLDKRYVGIPEWVRLPERRQLDAAARACALVAETLEPDYNVDAAGWRPTLAIIQGGPLPGIGGVLQAEHNMLVHLGHEFPTALNLRRVLASQRLLSHGVAKLACADAPELRETWAEREQTYAWLGDAARQLGGLVGRGGRAAAESANALSRLRVLRRDETPSRDQLRELNRLFTRVDARVAVIVEQGAAEGLYAVKVKVPRLDHTQGKAASPVRERYAPMSSVAQMDMLRAVREGLRTAQIAPMLPAHGRRQQLGEATDRRSLEQKPSPRR